MTWLVTGGAGYIGSHVVRALREGRTESSYLATCPQGELQIRFLARGETLLPAALSSMLAKYLRELSMRIWNRYWCARLPGLRPTAGYYTDGRRFLAEIEALANRLRIPPHWLQRVV